MIPMKRLSFFLIILICLQGCSKNSPGVSNSSGGSGFTGQGGSLARFTIARNHLYVVDDNELYAYSLANSDHPELKSKVSIGFAIETIYNYEDKLFIGSQNAMFIYSIADAGQPQLLGEASHVRACDPVVANDSLAYVTVRSGNSCGGVANALLVYDVSNVMSPVLRNTVPMNSPWGLGLKDNRLYVCDGSAGLVVYELSDPVHPRVVRKLNNETFYDVIATSDLLIAMVEGGTSLYSYQPGDTLTLMSKIAH
jgi:hypothetical protein